MIFFIKGDLFGHLYSFKHLQRHQLKLPKLIQTQWIEHKGLLVEFFKVLKMFSRWQKMKGDLFGHLFEVILRHFKSPKLTPGTIDEILIQVQNDFYQERLIWSFG